MKTIKAQGYEGKFGITLRPAYYVDPSVLIDHTISFENEIELTDQSQLKQSDINVIINSYTSQGLTPFVDPKLLRYADTTGIPPLEELFNIVNDANEAFMTLPAPIRKLMDNDPSQLENFISDPNNADHCLKYGLTELPVAPPESTLSKEINTQPVKNTVKTDEK